jgi:hypothetical protein
MRRSIAELRTSYSLYNSQNEISRLSASGVPIGETSKDKITLATAEQIFTALEARWRVVLIEMLAKSKLPEATAALARRAVFDLDASNRLLALTELKDRPSNDYLPVLLAALGHPWPPAADHAADALMELDVKQVVPSLVDMLEQSAPGAPFAAKKGEWPMVREVVRVNHLRNCMLCHAAQTSADLKQTRLQAPGLMPSPVQPVDPLSVAYYSRSKGDFIRADVTYLKQDFAVMQPVEDPGKWPKEQRYDYFVRIRPATVWERVLPPKQNYPQKSAVLMALKELTQMDCGDDAAAWREALECMGW